MNRLNPFQRKVAYIAAIAVLLGALSFISRPATREQNSDILSGGGILANLRQQHKLSQAELGDIDPSSVTVRLATLGLGGIAANILWMKADEYKKKEDWVSFGATLEQIVKLQPNFFKVWDYQAHNLSYNISAEFDDYRDRYSYVIKGINFLKQGVEKNESEPRLLNRIGWYVGQKIGRADEHKLYRRLFAEDWSGLFHKKDRPDRRPEDRDNWLVGKEYFQQSERLADALENKGIPLKTSPLIFYSEAGKSQINYAETLELEGRFDDVVKGAWDTAKIDWEAFGRRPIPTSFGGSVQLYQLEDKEDLIEKLSADLDAAAPGAREAIRKEKFDKLTPAAREALLTPKESRSPEEAELVYQNESKVKVEHEEIAQRASPDQQVKAKDLANQLVKADNRVQAISTERGKVNYEYWLTRCLAEREENTLAARRLTYQARKLHESGDPFQAVPTYEQAWVKWRQVIDAYPRMAGESVSAEELVEDINDFRKAWTTIKPASEKFPSPFILQDVLDIAEGKAMPDLKQIEKERRLKQQNAPPVETPKTPPVSDATPNTTAKPEDAAKPDDVAKPEAAAKPDDTAKPDDATETGNPTKSANDEKSDSESSPKSGDSTSNGDEKNKVVTLQIVDYPGIEKLIATKRGQVVVLDCWSTSCQPCRKEFPKLVALANAHREQVACVSLSFDYEGIGKPENQQDKVLKFLREQNATFDNVLCSLESDQLSEKLEIPSIPAVFVYDREGKLHKRFDNRNASKTGPFDYEQVQAVVDELLK